MRSRKFLIPVILGLLILAIAATVRWWLPPVLEFAGSDKDAIDSWERLLRTLLAPLAPIVAIIGLWLNYRHAKTVTTVVIEEVIPDEPKEDQRAPILEPLEPYFAHSYPLQQNFTGRVSEREMLTKWLVEDSHPVLALTAIGGMGKSALTWAWLQRDVLGLTLPGVSDEPGEVSQKTRVPEANRPAGALWWSFYTTESRFSAFLDRALSYVSSGDIDPSSISSNYDKAQDLLALLRQHNILLVLDGFERELRAYASLMAAYQDEDVAASEGEEARACSDPAASTFLRGIAGGALKSRVLLTSRLFPHELEGLTGQRREDLTSMDPEDAVIFFHAQGVRGTRAEIQAACQPYGYHPLALRLLAGVIVQDDATPGDIRVAERNPIPLELRGQGQQHHILQGSYDALDRPKQELLSKLAAFRASVDFQTIQLVFGEREEEETGTLAAAGLGGKPEDLSASLRELTNRGLLFREGNRYDIHPVVRQYAYARLTGKEGVHTRLRDYFAEIPAPEEDEVRSVEDLAPVIERFHHTVGAGQYDEARDLFQNRLSVLLYFRLGAYHTVIELLRSLFPDGEENPPKLEDQVAQAWTLNELGLSYSRTGQPRRAVPLKERTNTIHETLSTPVENIVIGLRNLAHDQLDLGKLEAAGRNLRRSIQASPEVDNAKQAEIQEANGQGELGRLLAYTAAFDEAAREWETCHNVLSKLGFPQGEGVVWAYRAILALQMGQADGALDAARQSRQLADVRGNERDISQAEWLLGAALVALAPKAGDERSKTLAEAESHLSQALTRCHRINLVELEPDILLVWARWHRAKGNVQRAREEAQEALAIADRSEYRLKQASIHNFLARLSLDEGALDVAHTHAETARERAWCDGPPHAYQPALDEAELLLQELSQDLD